MRIGVAREIKDRENRVALTPEGARVLAGQGHDVCVEHEAGSGAGYTDSRYTEAGARIVDTAGAWDCDLVLKVKEPQESEYSYFNGQILFTYLHLAGVPVTLTKALIKARVTAIAYETVEDHDGRFPLLMPMSAIAGNMAITIGNYYLARTNGGIGTQLGMVLGQRNGKVLVIGDGTVGEHATRTADGMGANVFLFGRNKNKFKLIRRTTSDVIQFVESSSENIAAHLCDADLVIGAVLLPGDRAPRLVSEAMIKTMQPGSVVVDVSVDQGGCFETTHVTTHSDPVYEVHGVIHYAVSNMPGAYPRTATRALTTATLPYILKLVDQGLDCLYQDSLFARGVNVHQGLITCKPVAHAHQLDSLYRPFPCDVDAAPTKQDTG